LAVVFLAAAFLAGAFFVAMALLPPFLGCRIYGAGNFTSMLFFKCLYFFHNKSYAPPSREERGGEKTEAFATDGAPMNTDFSALILIGVHRRPIGG
jgi:hypothetical protein